MRNDWTHIDSDIDEVPDPENDLHIIARVVRLKSDEWKWRAYDAHRFPHSGVATTRHAAIAECEKIIGEQVDA